MNEHNIHRKINSILSDRALLNPEKIELLKPLFKELNTIDIKTVKLIDRFIKGTYGSEYLAIQADKRTIIEFYRFLEIKFPEVSVISLSLADLLLLNHQYNDSINIFNQAFFAKPLLIFTAPGELLDILEKYGSDGQKISYYLSLVRAFIADQNFEDALEQYQEVMQRYGNNNKYVIEYLESSNIDVARFRKAQH